MATALLLGVTVAATAASTFTSLKSNKEQKEAAKLSREKQRNETRRRKRAAIRNNIISRGVVENVAGQTGTQQSSGVAGGLGSLESQLGSNIGFSNTQSGLSDRIASHSQRAADYQGYGAIAGAVGNLSSRAFRAMGGLDG